MINWLLTRSLVCLFFYNILDLSLGRFHCVCAFFPLLALRVFSFHTPKLWKLLLFSFYFLLHSFHFFFKCVYFVCRFFLTFSRYAVKYIALVEWALAFILPCFPIRCINGMEQYRYQFIYNASNPPKEWMLFQYVIGSFITKITFSTLTHSHFPCSCRRALLHRISNLDFRCVSCMRFGFSVAIFWITISNINHWIESQIGSEGPSQFGIIEINTIHPSLIRTTIQTISNHCYLKCSFITMKCDYFH